MAHNFNVLGTKNNAVTELNQYCQRRKFETPRYSEVRNKRKRIEDTGITRITGKIKFFNGYKEEVRRAPNKQLEMTYESYDLKQAKQALAHKVLIEIGEIQ